LTPPAYDLIGWATANGKGERTMMTRAQFDQVTRSLLKRQPFQPFVIEYDDGQRFVVGQPSELASFAGSASYFDPAGELHLIDSENVRQVIELNHGVAS
jgi:hypothetical protein